MSSAETNTLAIPETGYLTPQHISDFDYANKIQREKLTIFQKPFKVFYLLFEGSFTLAKYVALYTFFHPAFMYCIGMNIFHHNSMKYVISE